MAKLSNHPTCHPTCPWAVAAPRRLKERVRCSKHGNHDRPTQAAFGTRRILLENQDVGADVRRRMGEPVRRLCALLPWKNLRTKIPARSISPIFPASCWMPAVRLQGLCESVRPGFGLRQADAGQCPYPELAAAELRLQAGGRGPRSLLVASPDFGRSQYGSRSRCFRPRAGAGNRD